MNDTTQIEVQCVEVCKGDMVLGYVIFFSGGWDAYARLGPTTNLTMVATNLPTKEDALQCVMVARGKRS